MTFFKKANPQQARLKLSIYGPPGSGKTFTSLLMAEGLANRSSKRIAYVDTERGTDFYAKEVKSRTIHPNSFDFDALYTKSISEVTNAIKSLNPNEYSVIVIDSITHLWDSAMEAWQGKRTKIDSIPMHAWGKIKKPYKEMISWLISSPFHVFILGRQKNIFENDDDGEMKKVGVGMRAEGETAYEPHICIRMESRTNPDNTTQSICQAHIEKDRSGVLSGKVIRNPNFLTIEPLLGLLGDVQAPQEDEEERQAKDAELFDKDDEKNREKEQRSINILQELQTKIVTASSLGELNIVGEEVKKQKRYVIEDHLRILRELYSHKQTKLVDEQMVGI